MITVCKEKTFTFYTIYSFTLHENLEVFKEDILSDIDENSFLIFLILLTFSSAFRLNRLIKLAFRVTCIDI